MRYLVEQDKPMSHDNVTMAFCTCDNYAQAEAARDTMVALTGVSWTIWIIEYHFEGRMDGDNS